MSKFIAALSIAIILSGCTVNHVKWYDAEELCKPFGGVDHVPSHLDFALCKNGVYVQRAK